MRNGNRPDELQSDEHSDAGENHQIRSPNADSGQRQSEGKCIRFGHDSKDLANPLESRPKATAALTSTLTVKMLPAHGYPELRKFKHLVGNYGSGWQNQQVEFARFPAHRDDLTALSTRPWAAMTTVPTRSYRRLAGVSHLEGDDFGPVIARAQQMAGFPYSEIPHLVTVGFGRQTCSALPIRSSIWSARKTTPHLPGRRL